MDRTRPNQVYALWRARPIPEGTLDLESLHWEFDGAVAASGAGDFEEYEYGWFSPETGMSITEEEIS